MHFARNLIQGGAAALLGGALLGLTEASALLLTAGAPDRLAPFYAVVFYGLLALPFGMATGVGVTALEALVRSERFRRGVRRSIQVSEAHAWGLGLAGGVSPLLAFVLYYQLNKVVYGELGLPVTGWLMVAAVLGGFALFSALILPFLLRGPMRIVLRGVGLLGGFGSLAAATGAVAMLPTGAPALDAPIKRPIAEALRDKPNVVFIMVDAMRADHLGAAGLLDIPTPALDALAADGVLFESAYASASWTRPSTASMWTSRSPSGHHADTKAARLPDAVVTWAEVLRSQGVVTGALVNNINITETFGFNQGFDRFHNESPEYPFWASESVFGLTYYKVLHKLSARFFPGDERVEAYYQPADVVFADAMRFMEAHRDSRFALYVHAMETHDPYFEHPSVRGEAGDYSGVAFGRAEHENPDPADTAWLKQLYREEVLFFDRQLGAFIGEIKAAGLYDQTLVVLTADHGEEFYEHGGFWHGTSLYQEQLHVPLVMKLPGGARAGSRVPWQVRLIDLPPTLAAAMGAAPDPSWDGRDLVADLVALDPPVLPAPVEEIAGVERAAVVPALPAPELALVADEGLPVVTPETVVEVPLPPTPAECEAARVHPLDRPLLAEGDFEGIVVQALQGDGFKFIRANEGNRRGLPTRELFDRVADPSDTANLLPSGPETCGTAPQARALAMEAALDALRAAVSAGSTSGGEATMSAAECENLKALGYLEADAPCGQ